MTSEPFEYAKYGRPQFAGPLGRTRAAECNSDPIPAENLSEWLGRVSKNSTGELDSLIDEFERLREKLEADSKRIQRKMKEYAALSHQIMQFTKLIRKHGQSS